MTNATRSARVTSAITRNSSLDGLRGFAALAVVFAHTVVHLGLLPYAPLGAMGVLMFFVLSGYLIAGMTWRAQHGFASYLRFVRRRTVRLAPVVGALALIGGLVLATVGQLPPSIVLRDAFLALTQTSAFAQAAGVDVVPAFVPTWSLTVEWSFYLSCPVVLWWLRRAVNGPSRVWRWLAMGAAGLYVSGLLLPPKSFYLLPVANLGALYAGAALAIWHAQFKEAGSGRSDKGRSGLALMLVTVLVFLPGHTLGWGWKVSVFPATVSASLVLIHGCWTGDPVAGLLGRGPLPRLGLRAYSLYLWHMPVLWLVWVELRSLPAWAMVGLAVSIMVVVTECSFCFLERPLLGYGRQRTRPQSRRDLPEPILPFRGQ